MKEVTRPGDLGPNLSRGICFLILFSLGKMHHVLGSLGFEWSIIGYINLEQPEAGSSICLGHFRLVSTPTSTFPSYKFP